MEVILANTCESFTGSIDRSLGYSIQRRKNGFFAKRNSKGIIPPDGHWRFILACADLAQNGLHIADIRVSPQELSEALSEAGRKIPPKHLSILLACWRKHKGYKSRGREGWLRKQDADDFIRYAW